MKVRLLFLLLLFPLLTFSSWLPSQGDPWFIEKIELDTKTLPSGVIWNTENETLINSSDTPLIIVLEYENLHRLEKINPPEMQSVGYPSNGAYFYKFQNNQAYWWVTEHASTEPLNPNWVEKIEPNVKILLHWNNVSTANTPANMAKLGESTTFKDRPTGVVIPEPQTFSFNAYYGQQPITITGTIRYSLTSNYQSPSSKERVGNIKTFLTYISSFVGFCLVIWFFLRLRKKKVGNSNR